MSRREKIIKIGAPFLILLLGFGLMRLLIGLRQSPEKQTRPESGILVEVLPVALVAHPVRVSATGTIQPEREITLTPQVSGRVIWKADNFVPGGFFAAGDLLFRIEPVDYELALARAQAALAKAETELATTANRAAIARQEWETLTPEAGEPHPLVVFEPQLKEARGNLAAAHADLAQAQLNLARTELRAPFNCRVRSEQIDIGQYVKDGTGVAVLVGTDRAEVVVPLPLAELAWLDIPGRNEQRRGATAMIGLEVAGRKHQWQGAVSRSLGEADPLGRMLRVVVEIDDPYHLQKMGTDLFSAPKNKSVPIFQPDLVPGMFVEIALAGTVLPKVTVLPRRAVRENGLVWLVDEDNRLRLREVEIVRAEREQVVVKSGLAPGDRVVLTDITGAAAGMLLRVQESPAPREEPKEDR